MNIGTLVRTLYHHSELAVIIKPTAKALPKPGPDWFLIRFVEGGGKLYCHRDMLAIANSEAACAS